MSNEDTLKTVLAINFIVWMLLNFLALTGSIEIYKLPTIPLDEFTMNSVNAMWTTFYNGIVGILNFISIRVENPNSIFFITAFNTITTLLQVVFILSIMLIIITFISDILSGLFAVG